jgi:prepilin peptidase CpaA
VNLFCFTLREIVCIVVLTITAIIDIKTRRIPNVINLCLFVFGIVYNFVCNGWHGLFEGFLGAVIALGILIVPYSVGMLGAGDVKLMSSIGALMGYKFIIVNIWVVLIVGGLCSVIVLVIRKQISYVLFILKSLFLLPFTKDVKGFFKYIDETSTTSLPYGVPIMLGTVITAWYVC